MSLPKITLLFSTLLLLGLTFLVVRYFSAGSNEWHEEEYFSWRELHVPLFGKTGFDLLESTETGIDFMNNLTEDQIKSNRVLLNGSGVALGDVDSDGLVDIYFCRLNGANVLYKNLGDWKFEDMTEAAGVGCLSQFSSGAAFADIDGDNDLDLLLTAIGGPNACFLNDGAGRFTDVTESAGLTSDKGASSMALADIDGDDDLDLYVANYKKIRTKDIYTPFELGFNNIVTKTPSGFQIAAKFKDHYTLEMRGTQLLWFESAESDDLYLNNGHGQFERYSISERIVPSGTDTTGYKDWGLMVRFQDIDNDGDPDLYVCNDFESPDRILINDGSGFFKPIPKHAIRSTSNSSMAVDFSDIDKDGNLDFFVVDMLSREHQRRKTQRGAMVPSVDAIGGLENRPQYDRNTLFLNRGDMTYAEIAQYSDVQASEWSWSALFMDVDLDGYEDILITTGNYYDAQDIDTETEIKKRVQARFSDLQNAVFMYPRLNLADIAFHNQGDLTFAESGRAWGFDDLGVSHGIASADLDNDGDLDVVVNKFQKTAGIYENKSKAPRLAVRLKGLPPNTQAIGAKIHVLGGTVPQFKEVIAGGVYLSHSDPLYVFSAHSENDNLEIEVTWRSGKRTRIKGVKPNRIYEISETADTAEPQTQPQSDQNTPLFEDVSDLIQHVHHEEPFNDFWRQPLLSRRLSQLGPGVAWHDLDQDGDDDLLISTGRGGNLSWFRNEDGKTFSKVLEPALAPKSVHDQTSALGWSVQGRQSLLVGVSNQEDVRPGSSFIARYDFDNGVLAGIDSITVGPESIGALALADYDGDNDLDLFIAGRCKPLRYPEPASSYLFKNENGQLTLDEKNKRVFSNVGLVTGAVFSDIDGDSDPDLILSMEWGPVTIFKNQNGLFENVTQQLGMDPYLGWWNGVSTGDFNEDGQLDIVAGNWGLNSKYNMYREHPVQVYYHDFDNNGILDILEAYYEPRMGAFVPERGFNDLSSFLPLLRVRFRTHKQFAQSSLSRILGPRLAQADMRLANTFSHMLFINKGDRFEARPLPQKAQFAPVFSVGAADFDGDGHEDLFLSQNFFASEQSTPRCDAGRGLLLKGDGNGNFEAISGQESGIKVYGEQRGAAFCDYDHDGRTDLAVSQNGAQTKLYRNQAGKPGVRVKLLGPPENLLGIGAAIRLVYADGSGPSREVHAGSGYWSQDSAVQIMGKRAEPTGVWVRWPDGKVSKTPLKPGITEITVDYKTPATLLNSEVANY